MRYKVNWNLHIDGLEYKEGDFINLEDAKAKELLPSGVITREVKPFTRGSKTKLILSHTE
jgi:hypothetical protein